jgi:trehalose/maltose hydrolase-like predicted phosphorylase
MTTRATVEMYLCAFHLGKWEADESVEDAYRRALNITAAQFRRMQRDDYTTLQEKHVDAIHRMYEAAGVDLKTATEAEKALLRMRLIDEARKGGMRFPA